MLRHRLSNTIQVPYEASKDRDLGFHNHDPYMPLFTGILFQAELSVMCTHKLPYPL